MSGAPGGLCWPKYSWQNSFSSCLSRISSLFRSYFFNRRSRWVLFFVRVILGNVRGFIQWRLSSLDLRCFLIVQSFLYLSTFLRHDLRVIQWWLRSFQSCWLLHWIAFLVRKVHTLTASDRWAHGTWHQRLIWAILILGFTAFSPSLSFFGNTKLLIGDIGLFASQSILGSSPLGNDVFLGLDCCCGSCRSYILLGPLVIHLVHSLAHRGSWRYIWLNRRLHLLRSSSQLLSLRTQKLVFLGNLFL